MRSKVGEEEYQFCYLFYFEHIVQTYKNTYTPSDTDNNLNLVVVFTSTFSGSILLLVGMLLWKHRKFQSSHYGLMASACLAESAMLFCISF